MAAAFNRILVPVDFSAHSELALRYATALADRFSSTVEVLYVVDHPFVTGAWSAGTMAPNIPELLADLVTAARARLEELKVAALETGLHVTTTVLTTVATGRPADSICEHAATEKVDLIVMGTHGRTGLSHTLMGSVAERVVRKAPCPVLTVRETTSHAQKEAAPVAVVVI